MREIAVLSDIHGNYVALEKCIEYSLSRNVNSFIFLGDYLGELPYPQRTMEILHKLKTKYSCWFVKGNKEQYWFDYKDNGESGWKYFDSTTGALLYSYNGINEEDFAFFQEMEMVQKFELQGCLPFEICHGSPFRLNEKLLPNDERTMEIMDAMNTDLILCGHSHLQMEILHGNKKVLNPGAVGVPYNSGGKTQFLILQGNACGWEHEFINLDYNVAQVLKDLEESDLYKIAPGWSKVTARLLQDGQIHHGHVLEKAMELCKKELGFCHWPNIPEKYWENAILEMY